MDKPLLSICIPTFNRSAYLKKSLESLVEQDVFNEIELVISDNCSTDNTKEVVSKFQEKYKNIIYFRNGENIRDRNFPSVLAEANGIYRKIFNDNCIYHKGAIRHILELVKEYKDSEMRPFLFFLNLGTKKMTNIVEDGDTLSSFVKLVGFRTTWIGGLGLWEEECENLQEEEQYCSTSLWQVYKSLKTVSIKKTYVVSNAPLVIVMEMTKRDRSYGLYTVFYKNFFDLLKPYVERGEISVNDIAEVKKEMLYYQFADFVFQIRKKNTQTNYGKEINYRRKILKEYIFEPYFLHFILWYFYNYKLKKRINNLKSKIKKTRIGMILLKLKRKILSK